MVPIWATQAWTDAASLKYIELSASPDLAQTLGIKEVLEMRVSYMEEEYGRFTTIDSIKEWWKTRNYIRNEIHAEVSSSERQPLATEKIKEPEDPIKEALKKPRAPRKKK